jgi:hypothetical protein
MTAKRVYFFNGTQYVRFDSATNSVPVQYPLNTAAMWGGLPGTIDAAFYRGKGRAYFFVGDQYYRYTVIRNAVDAGYPRPIAGNWPGMSEAGFATGVDAAVNWDGNKVYFFKGGQYVRYDLALDKVDPGYPKPITGNWPGVAGGFETGIDDAVNYGNGKVYFFRGNQYLRLDLGTKRVDSGYPKDIAPNWPGVSGGISAALEWPYAEVAPSGFHVPTGVSGCKVVATTPGSRKAGDEFRMEVDFHEPAHPVTCAVGEYRQYVSGTFTVNGVNISHGLPNPAGGAPLTMSSTTLMEDGLVAPPVTMNVFYGHRIDQAGNGDPTDRYLPQRDDGCQYRGTDFPGVEAGIGSTYNVALNFQGDAIDRATSDLVLQSNSWSVNCSGTL